MSSDCANHLLIVYENRSKNEAWEKIFCPTFYIAPPAAKKAAPPNSWAAMLFSLFFPRTRDESSHKIRSTSPQRIDLVKRQLRCLGYLFGGKIHGQHPPRNLGHPLGHPLGLRPRLRIFERVAVVRLRTFARREIGRASCRERV